MRVQLLTFNEGGSGKMPYSQWQKYFQRSDVLELLAGELHDMKIFAVQESSRGSLFLMFLRNILKNYNISVKSYGSYLAPSFHVHILVATHLRVKGTRVQFASQKHNLFGTKSTVSAKIEWTEGKRSRKVVVHASHLPFDVESTNSRHSAMSSVTEATEKRWGPSDAVIWIGDLNFRTAEDGTNQIHDVPGGYQVIPIEDKLHPTCKLIRKKSCKFLKSEDPYDPTCYHPSRIPSYCDRILVGGKFKKQARVENITTLPREPPVSESDHLPVVVDLKLDYE